MKHKFIWVDAFTDRKFGGNPCAVVFSADSFSDEQMLTIAKEMGLSETAFIVKSSKADFGARYFTPAEEIPLAGHPTISVICALIETGEIVLKGAVTKISLELKAGVIGIEILCGPDGKYEIVMTQKKPTFLTIHDSKKVCEIFGIDESDLMPNCPIQTVSTGTPQLMIAVKNLAALQKMSLNALAYKAYKASSDFFSPHLFCLGGATSQGDTFARHPGVPPESAEDAFTGSATGGMGAYLWRYGLIEKRKFVAEQGHFMGRAGCASVEVVGGREDIACVKVGGFGVVLIFGEIGV